MTEVSEIERVPSGVPGLDTVLRGGFPRGGIHIVQGTPGAGKTILGNQICFHHAAAGGRALYATLLAESHARMLLHLGTLRFFDASRLPDQVSYVSGFGALEGEGLPGLLALLRREIAARKATVLVLDGLVAAEDRAASHTEFKKFVQELQAQAALHGCTAFLLTTAKGQAVAPEHTMVDGIVELTDVRYGSRTERGLFVNKLRGSDYLPGRHPFRITPRRAGSPSARGGGVPREHASRRGPVGQAVHGRRGPGRDARRRRPAGGHRHRRARPIGHRQDHAGAALRVRVRRGRAGPALRLLRNAAPPGAARRPASGSTSRARSAGARSRSLWQPLGENVQDALAHRLLDAVERRGVRRLFLDGLGGFIEASVEPGPHQLASSPC